MTNIQNVFERYEKKYLLDAQQYFALRQWLRDQMSEDRYGCYPICNLYYDTDDYSLIRASIEKPVYKEKLRLRSYGVPGGDSDVFLELKKKMKGVVYKRRTTLPLREANSFLTTGHSPQNSQIISEISWFLESYQLSPKVFLAYDRLALFGNEDPELRVTFDQDIRWRRSLLDLSKGDWGYPLLENGVILMEIKIPDVMPLWLSKILARLEIYPISFSKYGSCYQNFLIYDFCEKEGVHCA